MAENATLPSSSPKESTHVIVRPYPKVVYLYLTWIASLICGILAPASMGEVGVEPTVNEIGRSALLGQIWVAIFTFNILVISFEFSRIRSVALVFLLIALILAGSHWGFLAGVGSFITNLGLHMSKTFYFVMAAIFSIIYGLVFVNTRFNYWEIQPNEILHHHGFLGDVNRYPTRGLRMKKEISDVMEAILLRAGTLVLDPPGEQRPILLQNVINITKVEDKIQRLLGTLKVRIDRGQVGGLD